MEPGTFLTAWWRHLVMLNHEVDPALLRSRVPAGTVLDAWQGRTLASVVGFMFERTRLLGALPVPFHTSFEEVNLRFYVRRGDRRGVVFVKELVPRLAIALCARLLYNESYVALPMRHSIEVGPDGLRRIEYGFSAGDRWGTLAARAEGTPALPAPGSEEEFVTEHYYGYARQRDGGTVEYEVAHPRWPVLAAQEATLDADLDAIYGSDFARALRAKPSSAFVCEGSAVVVKRGVRIAEM
jgi:uncharacterized protein YqjF (DUF2071 family)